MSSSLSKWIIQSPPVEWGSQKLQEIILAAIRQGPVPQHIAFVMDGNRRYARTQHMETIEGHSLGFEAMARTLEICYKIGVKVVTMYAFSIENFKRTKYEVEALMDMAKVKLSQLAQHGELLERYGAKIQFLGQREMVRSDVLESIDKAIRLTSHNDRATLNICAPYTSRDEITTAIRNTVADYSEPIRPPLKRPFSETHIARNIRAQQFSTVAEGEPSEVKAANDSQENPDDEATDEDFVYNPSNSDSKAAFEGIMDVVSKATVSSKESAGAKDIIRLVSSSILRNLKDEGLSQEQRIQATKDMLPDDTPSTEIDKLVELAKRIKDFDPPADSTIASGSTLLNASADRNHSTSPSPQNYPDPETITEHTLTAHTFTGSHTPPLDLLIRTSGVERLSDFMLWQCHQDTEVVFLKCLWPEFDLWHFLPVLLEWQWRHRKEGWTEPRIGRRRKAD